MLTDDPGIVDLHKWEINTSINTDVADETQLAAPYLDINYGVAPHLQLKIEAPYLFTIQKQKEISGAVGDIVMGTKFRFLSEDKNFISVGIYPQLTIRGEKGFLFPLLLEKTIGRFLVGEAIGVFWGNENNLQNGILLGYRLSDKAQVMGEYFMEKSYNSSTSADGFINFGFRKTITPIFTLMGSIGTQVNTPTGGHKEYFISFLGIQSSF